MNKDFIYKIIGLGVLNIILSVIFLHCSLIYEAFIQTYRTTSILTIFFPWIPIFYFHSLLINLGAWRWKLHYPWALNSNERALCACDAGWLRVAGSMVAHVPLIWVDVLLVALTAGVCPGQKIQSHVGLGPIKRWKKNFNTPNKSELPVTTTPDRNSHFGHNCNFF